jgi:hypothetical protein
MSAPIQRLRFRATDDSSLIRTSPALQRVAKVEAARGRLRAAALRGEPADAEAAARAYGGAIVVAGIAGLRSGLARAASAAWRRLREPGPGLAGVQRAGR